MENIEIMKLYILCSTILLSIIILSVSTVISYIIIKNRKLESNERIQLTSQLSIDDTINYQKFFDNLLLVKFNFYANQYLANMLKGKSVDKSEIKSGKDQFYIDVSSTLNKYQKEQLLKIYSERGIELYIHQSFLRMLNDIDIKMYQTNDSDVGLAMTKELYKGL